MIYVPYNVLKRTLANELDPADAARVMDSIDAQMDAMPNPAMPTSLQLATDIIRDQRQTIACQAAEIALMKRRIAELEK